LARLWKAGAFLPLEKRALAEEAVQRLGRDYFLYADLPHLKPLNTFRKRLDEAERRIDAHFTPAKQSAVTLTNVKIDHALSDETLAFSATVNIDGQPAFSATNHGQGGSNEYRPLRSKASASYRSAVDKVVEIARACGYDLEPADELISDLLDEIEFRRKVLTQINRSKTVFQVPSEPDSWRSYDSIYTVAVRNKILADFPDAIFLNETIAGQTPRSEEVYGNRILRALKTSTVFRRAESDELRIYKRPYSPEAAAFVRGKYPGAYILNEHIDHKGNPK